MEKDLEWDCLPGILSLLTVQRVWWGETNQNEIFATEIKCPNVRRVSRTELSNLLPTHNTEKVSH